MKIDKQWNHIFTKYNIINSILENNKFIIKADDIKKCKDTFKCNKKEQFEPRLLCYQTTEKERPCIFKDNNICILPIKNGEYMLTQKNIFYKLEYIKKNIIYLNKDYGSILNNIGGSESNIINNLLNCRLFESEKYMNEKIKYLFPIQGRHYCSFEMNFNNELININSVQYEIDGSIESDNKILLIECKNNKKEIESFNIRQIYYPYRAVYEHVKDKKEIICLYIVNIIDIIYIWNFKFKDYKNLNSIECVDYNCYKFTENKVINKFIVNEVNEEDDKPKKVIKSNNKK